MPIQFIAGAVLFLSSKALIKPVLKLALLLR